MRTKLARWFGTLSVLLFLSALGPRPAVADEQGVAAAKDLMVAMGVEAQFSAVLPMLMKPMGDIVKKSNPGKEKEIDEVFDALGKRFIEKKNEVIGLIAPVYAEKFTEAEIKEMAAFFRSPVGEKWVKNQPDIVQKSMAIGSAWGQKIGIEIDKELRDELTKRGMKI